MVSIESTEKNKITFGTKEWADYNVNCIKGCSNDCRYCYARMMAKRFGRATDDNWKEMTVNSNAVSRNYGKYHGRVMFPSTHDITEDASVLKACIEVLKKLLTAGNEVLVTSKPKLSIIKLIIKEFTEYREQLQFRFTITSINNRILEFWEPGAPLFEERLASLLYAFANDFKTSVSIEPFLDYTPQELVHKIAPYVTESIWIGPMNYISRNGLDAEEEKIYEEIRNKYEYSNLLNIYNELLDFPLIRFKDSMLNRLNIKKQEQLH
jgi:DNA repair photolyase